VAGSWLVGGWKVSGRGSKEVVDDGRELVKVVGVKVRWRIL